MLKSAGPVLPFAAAVVVLLPLLLPSVRETAVVVGILLLSSIPNADGNISSSGDVVNNAPAANESAAAAAVLVKERCGWFL
jgi:uncharacterized protein involved in propanediol utilization